MRSSTTAFRRGSGRYYDHHHKADPATLTLAEVRASVAAGEVVHLAAPSQALWYRRLFYDAGFVPVRLRRLDLPRGLSPTARRVVEGFARLLALRDASDDAQAPFARAFAGAWCGIGERQAGEGISGMRDAGLLRRVGRHGRMYLYRLDVPTHGLEMAA